MTVFVKCWLVFNSSTRVVNNYSIAINQHSPKLQSPIKAMQKKQQRTAFTEHCEDECVRKMSVERQFDEIST